MIKKMKIYPAHIVKATDNMYDVAVYMKKHEARYVFVVDNKKAPVGIISLYDIVFKVNAMGKDQKAVLANDVMVSPVDHVDINQEAEFALNIMMKRHSYACLVTDKGKIKGLVDYKNVFEAVVKHIQEAEKHGSR